MNYSLKIEKMKKNIYLLTIIDHEYNSNL